MTCHSQTERDVPGISKDGRKEDGYALMTLLLVMALLMIFAAAIVPSITFDIKRDREEEMIHRGVQYSRAIRAYYKKFGRYPTKIEDLESANNLRFLRKRYKDPLSCKNSQCADFRLLHFGEVQLTLSVMGGAPGGVYTGAPGFSQTPTLNGNSNSPLVQNQPGVGNPSTGSDTSQLGSQASSSGTGSNPSGSGDDSSGSNPLGSGQIIGGPIIGVASTSKDKTIREFSHKNKYKDWVFVYDPGQDMGRLITTPYQPQLLGFTQQNINGPNGTGGIGNGNGIVPSPQGTQNNPNSPTNGGFGTPNPPSNPPEQ
jgi:type II secretory pathway pseudopilin PulG